MSKKYEKAAIFFEAGAYSQAFSSFLEIASDLNSNPEIRSDAYNMLGVILVFDPSLSEGNEIEERLDYFRKSIELNPNNFGVALNIIESYGTGFDEHLDSQLFDNAFICLSQNNDELTEKDAQMIKVKQGLRKKN